MTSNLSPFPYFQEREEATPAAFNNKLSIISANIAAVDSNASLTVLSGTTISISTNLEVVGGGHFQFLSIGSTPPSYSTTAAVTIEVNSNQSDYLYLVDSAAQRSSYVIGSRAGGTADGLNIWDASAGTMIASFSKQSIRFFQNVVGPVFDVGGALADTLNAATFGTGADSRESRIQAAISAASAAGIHRVYVPANLYPYSAASVSFDTRVQMVREGGDWTVYDVFAYGAYGDDIHNDAPPINAAISGASGFGGGKVYLPAGAYLTRSSIILPATNANTIRLEGVSLRDVTIRPDASVHTAILVGLSTDDTRYAAIARMTITGAEVSQHTGCGLSMLRPQYCTVDDVNIEEFDGNGGTGLYLSGAVSANAPHAYRCRFTQLFVATTQRPGYMVNADENTFIGCTFGVMTGSTSSVTALEINQGRNNRFYSTLLAGETSSLTTGRPNYIGLYASAPLLGANGYNQFYGIVTEGFEKGIVINSTFVQGYQIFQHHSSINSVALVDNGQDTIDWSPQQAQAYYAGAYPYSPLRNPASGTQIIDVAKGNVFGAANASLTTVVGFSNVSSGKMFWFFTGSSDAGVVLADSSASLRLWGRTNFAMSPEMAIPFVAIGGTVYQAGPPLLNRSQTISGSTNAFEVPLPVSAVSDGRPTIPQFTFSSERSLGWYRSGASCIGLSYGQLVLPQGSTTTPSWTFSGDTDNGVRYDGVANSWSLVAGANAVFRVNATQAVVVGNGNALAPSLGWASELSLGLYRSGNSSLVLSYGTLDLTASGAVTSIASLTIKSGSNNACGTAVLGSNGSVNVANTYVKTGDLIFLTDQTPGGTLGDLEILGIRNSSGFTIGSTSVTDTSTVAWLIVRPG